MKKIQESWFNNPAHPVWILIRQVVVMVPLVFLLALGYKNGWTASDWKTLIVPLASLGIFDFLKRMVSGSQDKSE